MYMHTYAYLEDMGDERKHLNSRGNDNRHALTLCTEEYTHNCVCVWMVDEEVIG